MYHLLKVIGGDEEDRTPDPLLARQVLSQLSYTPKFSLILRQFRLGVHKVLPSPYFLVLTKINLINLINQLFNYLTT